MTDKGTLDGAVLLILSTSTVDGAFPSGVRSKLVATAGFGFVLGDGLLTDGNPNGKSSLLL